jgi:hypothetical protein
LLLLECAIFFVPHLKNRAVWRLQEYFFAFFFSFSSKNGLAHPCSAKSSFAHGMHNQQFACSSWKHNSEPIAQEKNVWLASFCTIYTMEAGRRTASEKQLVRNQKVSRAVGDFIEGPAKRRHRQRLFGYIIQAVGKRQYLVQFDNCKEKELLPMFWR